MDEHLVVCEAPEEPPGPANLDEWAEKVEAGMDIIKLEVRTHILLRFSPRQSEFLESIQERL
jgi:hypothetical protein